MAEKIRLDKYLWAIRLFKTRSLASDAIDAGKVKFQGSSVKPSKAVSIGDEYDVKTEGRRWIIKVRDLLEKRIAYSEAIKYYIDLTPPEELEKPAFQSESFYTGKRPSKVGRPTKKQRREMDDFFGEEG